MTDDEILAGMEPVGPDEADEELDGPDEELVADDEEEALDVEPPPEGEQD